VASQARRHNRIAAIEARLPAVAAREAINFLDRYLTYFARTQSLGVIGFAGSDPQARLEELWRIRRETLGDRDAEVFFGDDEALARLELERERIAKDETRSPEERQRELDALEERLPEHVEREQALAPLRLWQDEQALRAKGATPEEIRALRERRFGKEAADRLMDLDRQRAEWQDRLDAYHHERQRNLSDPRLSEGERSKALRDLMTGSFTPPERIRLQALDRIQAEGKKATRGPSAGP